MKLKGYVNLFLVAVLVCSTGGCASEGQRKGYNIHSGFQTRTLFVVYDGPIVRRESTAILIIGSTATIATIDGQRVDNDLGPIGVSDIAQFMPGKHVIGVGYLDTSVHSTSYNEITLEAEKGHVYLASATGNIKITWAHDPQGNWETKITDITAELDDQDNHDIDQALRSGHPFIRLSDLLAGDKKWLQNRIP